MLAFAVRRLVQTLLSLWAAVTLVFVAVTQLPGDPVRALFGFRPPPPELYARIRSDYHLDEPLLVQYGRYLRDLLTGDWGQGLPTLRGEAVVPGPAVVDVVGATAPVSAVLLAGAVALQLGVGVVAGALAASGRWSGTSVYAVATLLVGTPVVVAAYLLRFVFVSELTWAPYNGRAGEPAAYVLPVIALAALSTGYVALITRAEVGDTLRSPFVQAARGRGLSVRRVIGVHALRPALTPVMTFVAANAGQLVVGLVVVEGVFGMPGIGNAILGAIEGRDRALLVGLTMVVIAAVIVANAVADVAAAALDPRVRPQET
ncbi:ABC-type dipeptide/oligopeptide/nickel transport system permease component [Geodermatophilus bullaregiensis]|uniref:ABC transporter permease n=1 Tax=Geodermatophilus bullaregiensis TaxID=1564160 RepID=UPI001956448F|nr:ABC transporter permease [Geodermatophilus bullaregiensis]MBM7804303.1 ABC-type dipeptide/oligopeptide/nickel transport system permease component [Geodermatophilus bullaregiensis]